MTERGVFASSTKRLGVGSSSGPDRQAGRAWWFVAAILVAVFLAHFPALRGGFIWDDEAHVTSPAMRSLSGLGRIWFELGATQQYYPLTHTVFWLEHRLWGGNAVAYHAANLALHALAAILLGLVLRRLALRGAWLAALIFAVHPVHVESVAWISEQKNTLSTAFYLAAALAYLRYDAQPRRGTYLLATGLFLLALASKTVTATLPAALLVVFWWQRGRLSWRRDVAPLAPWFASALVAGCLTAWVERKLIGAEGAAFELSLLQRALLAGNVVWFYAGKLLWPESLAFFYPRWAIGAAALRHWAPLLAALALLVTLGRWQARSRGPLAAALLFGGTLFPVLGFFNVYPFQYSFVADHFQYLASIPLIALGAEGIAILGARASRAYRVAPGLVLPALALLAWQQAHLYRDERTLYRATLARNPSSWIAHNNLGRLLMTSKSDLPSAIPHLQRALALRPEYPEALNNLGLALTQSGRPDAGLPFIEQSLRLKPGVYQAHNNLGIALAGLGRAEEAVLAFRRAAALNPTMPNIHENWARALLLLGRQAEADERFAIAAKLRANDATR